VSPLEDRISRGLEAAHSGYVFHVMQGLPGRLMVIMHPDVAEQLSPTGIRADPEAAGLRLSHHARELVSVVSVADLRPVSQAVTTVLITIP
jgi:hypothetical protein